MNAIIANIQQFSGLYIAVAIVLVIDLVLVFLSKGKK